MSQRRKKNLTFNARFTLEKYHFTIKEFTRDIANIYVSTLVISQIFWQLMYIWKIYLTLYVIFYNILFNNIIADISCWIFHYYIQQFHDEK